MDRVLNDSFTKTMLDADDKFIHEGIVKLTEDDCKISLKTLTKLNIQKEALYRGKGDLNGMSFDESYKIMLGDRPKYVEFNNEPYLYEKAYWKAVNEVYHMFKDCNSYMEAKALMMADDRICSIEKGYSVSKGCTGNLYGEWTLIYGVDDIETIFWDVRWY